MQILFDVMFVTAKLPQPKNNWKCMTATDTLVLKRQAISIHSADWISIILGQFHTQIWVVGNNIEKSNYILEKDPQLLKG